MIKDVYDNKLEEAGEQIVEIFRDSFNNAIGYESEKLGKTFIYKVENNELKIYASKIVQYLDKGTNPYIIRAKPGKSLAFKTMGNFVSPKTGIKYTDGQTVMVKQVNHPGITERPFIEAALFISKKQIIENLKNIKTPTLAFVSDGDKIYPLR